MSALALNPQQIAEYHREGFVIARKMFTTEEANLILRTAETDEAMQKSAYIRSDTTGSQTRMTVWSDPGDDIFGMFSRSERIVDSMESLIGDEVYHYNSKLNAKEPFEGGAWEWHQDYGYWYNNGCLFPMMASCLMALDPCTVENGCLQVLRRSHLVGRVDHVQSGKQVSADPARVEHLVKQLETVQCVMEPGDVIFFHCNMLHTSARNDSPKRRWVLISCYNAKSNDPVIKHHHPQYNPLKKVPDSAILEVGMRPSAANKKFLDKPYNPLEYVAK
ncbi:phytanoyl-CoA dioxygenase family protein [Burkholderia sp. L27(2015)]|uniref:phytanoyl-CoA dioxygenase family protein n=1 Tax=Burkholderia sp. L27(2015) TaxID=1641858 RepID=UPI00131B39A6|nr:phytanoyl-CoA dioxygenase family protein [Burkholderia sp. L27(2015)]